MLVLVLVLVFMGWSRARLFSLQFLENSIDKTKKGKRRGGERRVYEVDMYV